MNRTKLKNYAPKARREFIQAVTDRAALYGLTKGHVEPITEQGDVVIILGKPFPRSLAAKRNQLEERVHRHGFQQVMEAMAYTWFNRFVAIRFMELHGYLDHGYRVLSHPDPAKTVPEILEHAEHVALPDLDKNRVIELKLDGTKDSELYRMLLIAQCNALSKAMPFLFERIDDDTELLLPDNLLNSDSLIRKLVTEIEENDWQEVEIIGWLYQFYISEKKDQVIGKVVKSEDIPAATQLFTPNWIVKYLVQNSLGRQWVATYPDSPLRKKMEYYIEPAEQTPQVQAQLAAITPKSLDPEKLTLMDPACGSGHILVEGYDLLKDIYLERGYRLRDIPSLILTKNLFGLEIDDRAAQLAAFALMMKARADDRSIFDGGVQPNVLAIQETNGLNINAIVQAFTSKKVTDESFVTPGELGFMAAVRAPLFAEENRPVAADDDQIAGDLKAMLELFKDAKTFGSLITVPQSLAERLPALAAAVQKAMSEGNLHVQGAARLASVFVTQARLLSSRYDGVVANPPYMGGKFLNPSLKSFLKDNYSGYEKDLFSAFVIRNMALANTNGLLGLMSPFVWMFISSYEQLRYHLIDKATLSTLIQLEYSGFDGATVPICTFTLNRYHLDEAKSSFIKLSAFKGADQQAPRTLEAIRNKSCGWFHEATPADFKKIPGSPIAYWISPTVRNTFKEGQSLGSLATPTGGMTTGNNERFLRYWFEVSVARIGFMFESRTAAHQSGLKWFPYNKGGEYRRWYGNNYFVVNWENDGKDIIESGRAFPRSKERYFNRSITWTATSSSYFGVRHSDAGFIFDAKGPSCFAAEDDHWWLLGLVSTKQVELFLSFLNPTIEFQTGDIAGLPVPRAVAENSGLKNRVAELVKHCVGLARVDWDEREVSWNFQIAPPLGFRRQTIALALSSWEGERERRRRQTIEWESEINRLFIDAYGLQGEVTPEVTDDQITLARPDRDEDIKRLLCYALGCMMGRYSLDKPGLSYANSGDIGFDASRYSVFPADRHGIVPVTDIDWFADDATNRFVEFVGVAWPSEHLEENLKFVADSLGAKSDEQPRETIRRYFADEFFKDHLKTYRRRPIYWLFTSGKLGAFQCLVYLHRYDDSTFSRIRTGYVIPLQGKIASRLEQIGGKDGESGDIATATSMAHKKKLGKEYELLKKHQVELAHFDEKLRHYADLRIKLDLDDGVKVNYGKFGDLLAGVTQVCGKADGDE